jgi:FixJ family two-component response regulator
MPLASEEAAPTVAVVEDDPTLRRGLQRLLQATGITVATFGSAEDFLALEKTPPYRCLVLDIRLPLLSGFDLYDRLRASGISIPTIFITGHDDASTRERARTAGAAGYMPKPFDAQRLIDVIEATLSRTH